MWKYSTLNLLAFLLFAYNANAALLFFDDFESDLSLWSSNRSGVIVADPLETDSALSFSLLSAGGDIFSIPITNPNPTNEYILSFDYLGVCGNSDCGGFIGYEPGDVWVAGTGNFRKSFDLEDTGTWEHYELSFTGPLRISLQVEDWSGSGGVAGDIYFDNISVETVPLPASIWLFGSGLFALIGFFKKRKTG